MISLYLLIASLIITVISLILPITIKDYWHWPYPKIKEESEVDIDITPNQPSSLNKITTIYLSITSLYTKISIPLFPMLLFFSIIPSYGKTQEMHNLAIKIALSYNIIYLLCISLAWLAYNKKRYLISIFLCTIIIYIAVVYWINVA